MVQRKTSNNKLGIQADHVKSEKRLANLIKPFSHHHQHHQDGKNRGTDHLMKKKMKMKKSISIKLSDIESLKSSTLKNTFSLPGKPPPITMTSTPQRHSPTKTNDRSPNYMKSTSSSEAKKGTTAQVRRNLFPGDSCKSKLNSGSGNKTVRSLTKTSSLKMVRTLTKTPSFKHVRAVLKKCSNGKVVRATCSSTLKDSKFPDYLVLSPGGDEVEGTSIMKVCPYTYCSLNGHHHKPSPPLKRFLSARRRMMKTQKSMKLEALSLPTVKQGVEEKRDSDFFIEIYAKSKENICESTSGGSDQAKVEQKDEKRIDDDLLDRSTHSDIDFEGNVKQKDCMISMGVGIVEGFLVKQKPEDPDIDCLNVVAPNDAEEEFFDSGSEFEEEYDDIIEEKDSNEEVTEMEWEEGKFTTSELNEVNRPMNIDNESELDDGYLSEPKNQDLHGERVEKSEKLVAYCSDVIQADEVSEDESESFNMESSDSDSEMDGTNQIFEIAETEMGFVGLAVACDSTESDETPEKNLVAEAEDEIPETNHTSRLTYETLQQDEVVTEEPNSNGSEMPENSEVDHNVAVSDFGPEEERGNRDVENRIEETEKVNITRRSIGIQVPDMLESFLRIIDLSEGFFKVLDSYEVVSEADIQEDNEQSYTNSSQDAEDEVVVADKNLEDSSKGEYDSANDSENTNSIISMEKDEEEAEKFNSISSKDSKEQDGSNEQKLSPKDSCNTGDVKEMQVDSEADKTKMWKVNKKQVDDDDEEGRRFNPREPNYLPVVAQPDGEKVDLRPQNIDEKKNTEEWMVDYALRQAVTKLAPARKRKVALLVEAFETVMPLPKWESKLRTSNNFAPARTIQACS